MNSKIGIVLSGGGARGIGHLALLKVMEDCGIRPDMISGTSAGAMVGAFYAMGYTPQEIISVIEQRSFFNMTSFLFRKQGVFAMKAFESLFNAYFPANDFADLKIPLYAAATNLTKGNTVYFSEGNLAKALMASACIPIVFQPIIIDDDYYVDGGVLNNFPIEPLMNHCKIIIGSNVNSLSVKRNELHMTDVIDRSFHLAMSGPMAPKIHRCDVFFEPPEMTKFSVFDTKKAKAIYDYSYEYALKLKDQLLEIKHQE